MHKIDRIKCEREGMILQSRKCGEFIVLEYARYTSVRIKFLNTGHIKVVTWDMCEKGQVKDPFAPIGLGGTYIGSAYYFKKTPSYLRCFSVWKAIVARCYDPKCNSYPTYGALGTRLGDEWLNFTNFHKFYMDNHKEGLHLDKDLKSFGSLLYSEETCLFIPRSINNFIRNSTGRKSTLSRGVNKKGSKFEGFGGYAISKLFDTEREAYQYYVDNFYTRFHKVVNEEYQKGVITDEVRDICLDFKLEPYLEDVI